MATFGQASKRRLFGLHPDLQAVMNKAIQYFDFSVIAGTRTKVEQQALYKKGREKRGSKWLVIDRLKVVTNCDGINKKSAHQDGKAVDIVPYFPQSMKRNIWARENAHYFYHLAGIVHSISEMYCELKVIKNPIVWGGDWDGDGDLDDNRLKDLPHYQI